MKPVFHAILNFTLHILALLPLSLLYILSDVAAAILYHMVRYRRKLVRRNLTDSFPECTPAEIRRIERMFYRNFADYAVETLKLMHISDSAIMQRMHFEGMEIIEHHLQSGRSVVCYFSHCGNWEWVTSLTLHAGNHGDKVKFCQVYRPLKNKWFDSLMLKLRSRFGSVSLPKKTTLRHMIEFRRNGIHTVSGFMSDQKPSHGDMVHVVRFLNHPTAMITGTETLARRLDMAAVYFDMHKTARGRYRVVIRPMCDSAAETPDGMLTDLYASLLEQTIRRNPAIWLWSHNRWKFPVEMPQK